MALEQSFIAFQRRNVACKFVDCFLQRSDSPDILQFRTVLPNGFPQEWAKVGHREVAVDQSTDPCAERDCCDSYPVYAALQMGCDGCAGGDPRSVPTAKKQREEWPEPRIVPRLQCQSGLQQETSLLPIKSG